MNRREVFGILSNCYVAEVKSRVDDVIKDESTTKALQNVATWLANDNKKPSLLLFGGVGNGKTTMARAIAAAIDAYRQSAVTALRLPKWMVFEVNSSNRGSDDAKVFGLLTKVSKLPRAMVVTAQKLSDMAKKEDAKYCEALSTGLLILDDLGCEPTAVKTYGTEITPVIDLIYTRYDAMLPTIVTTNLDKEDIRQVYGARVADRIEEAYDAIAFDAPSYRTRK